jgi:hypothetical protein
VSPESVLFNIGKKIEYPPEGSLLSSFTFERCNPPVKSLDPGEVYTLELLTDLHLIPYIRGAGVAAPPLCMVNIVAARFTHRKSPPFFQPKLSF